MAHVTVINEHHHLQQVVSGHHHLVADEDAAAGGGNAGLAPRELMLASLGCCTAIALRKDAARQDWSLGKITVGLRWSQDPQGREHIHRRLAFARTLDGEQKGRLLEVAAATPMTRVLSGAIAIESSIAD
jgi:putative redox protein